MSFKSIGAKVAVVGASVALSIGAATGTAFADPGVASIGPGSDNTAGVKCVQRALNYWAAGSGTSLNVDGSFGQLTFQAVQNYQSANNLSADGIVGKDTGTSMYNQPGFSNYFGNCWGDMPTWS
ncbi:peptidoglycan-binding domain-containing protein [Kitasatospora sp. NPDC001683]